MTFNRNRVGLQWGLSLDKCDACNRARWLTFHLYRKDPAELRPAPWPQIVLFLRVGPLWVQRMTAIGFVLGRGTE